MNIKKLKKAAQSYGTPLYVYDLSVIDRQLEKLKVAFNKINNYQIHFAAKALSNISILKYINSLGLGLDAVSIEEVKSGIKCGFKKEEILFTPNGVNFSEIKEAATCRVDVNDLICILRTSGFSFGFFSASRIILFIILTASKGYLPEAVSPESINASVPS